MGFANNYRGHKTTLCCPISDCKYHSRKFVSGLDKSNILSNSSTKCPIHQKLLIDIGGSKYSVTKLASNK